MGCAQQGAPRVFKVQQSSLKYSLEIPVKVLPLLGTQSVSVPILCRLVFTTMEDFGRQTRLQSRCFMQEAALVSSCSTVPEKSAEIHVAL